MRTYEVIEKYIQERDVNGLRESIGTICYICRNFSDGEFDEVVEYVKSKGIPLLEDDLNGELVSANKDTFTDDDFARAVFELKDNFCQARIDDVKKIGKTLYKKGPVSTSTVKQKTGVSPNPARHQAQKKFPKIVKIVIGLVAVVVVICGVVILMKKILKG